MRLREIERLRAIAALMVIYVHTRPPLGPFGSMVFGLPRTGVDLFFVISGFVVTRSLLRILPDLHALGGVDTAFQESRGALRLFYTRRFFRIVPLAVATMFAYRFLITLGVEIHGGTIAGYWREVFAIFTGVYNYVHPYNGYRQFAVFWSLSVEEHFYLLLPLAFLLARTRAKRAGVALFGIAFVALVCRNLFDSPPPGSGYELDDYRTFSSHLRFDTLLAGVLIALLFDAAPSRPFMPPRFMKWVVMPACLALVWAVPPLFPTNVYLHQGMTATWFFCGILVTYASFDQGYVFEIPILGRVLEYLGGRSYAMYLLHIPLTRLFFNDHVGSDPALVAFRTEHPWPYWTVFLLTVVAASEVSWRVLEAPMQRLGRRLTDSSLPPWRLGARARVAMGAMALGGVLLWYQHAIARLLGPPNLALGARVTASPWDTSAPGPEQLTNGELEAERGFETKHDKHPWAVIDLGKDTAIGTIVTYNRNEGYQDDVLPLTIELSSDGMHFSRVGTRTTIFSQWFPWRLAVGGIHARYVRYTGADDGYICLAESEVYAP